MVPGWDLEIFLFGSWFPNSLRFDDMQRSTRQGGRAKYKHKIIEYPEASTTWYILRCDEHNVHFAKRSCRAVAARRPRTRPRQHKTAASSLCSTLASLSSSSRTTASWPLATAHDNGVRPYLVSTRRYPANKWYQSRPVEMLVANGLTSCNRDGRQHCRPRRHYCHADPEDSRGAAPRQRSVQDARQSPGSWKGLSGRSTSLGRRTHCKRRR